MASTSNDKSFGSSSQDESESRNKLIRLTKAQTLLPLSLFPTKSWRQPPKWHYGYAAYFEDGVNDVLVRYAINNPNLGIQLAWPGRGGVYVPEIDAEVDIHCVITGVMAHLYKKLKRRVRTGREAMDGDRPVAVLAFCNNYSTRRPDHPDIQKDVARVKSMLGVVEEPKWFIDDESWIDSD